MDRKWACHCSETMILLMSHVKMYHRGFRKLLFLTLSSSSSSSSKSSSITSSRSHRSFAEQRIFLPSPWVASTLCEHTRQLVQERCTRHYSDGSAPLELWNKKRQIWVQRQGTLPSPPPHPKTPIIAVASTMCATSRNVTIAPTPPQDTRHCRSIEHVCNVKERYHHPHPNPRHPSLP